MEYEHSDEIKMLRQTVRDFVDKEIRPIAREIDEEERVPFEVLKKAGEIGLFGVPFPEKYGGLDMGITGYCVLMEELNRACASMAGEASRATTRAGSQFSRMARVRSPVPAPASKT